MGGICKLIIKAYADDSFSSEKGEFKSSVNPSNLRIVNNVNYTSSQMMGGINAGLRYNTSDPPELGFSLIFNNTGVIIDNKFSVKDQIDCLKKVVLDYQKALNEPFFVRVIWGTLDFKGKLKKCNISYKAFQSDGNPVSAEVDMAILEYKTSTHDGKSGDQNNNSKSNNENSSSSGSKSSGVSQGGNSQNNVIQQGGGESQNVRNSNNNKNSSSGGGVDNNDVNNTTTGENSNINSDGSDGVDGSDSSAYVNENNENDKDSSYNNSDDSRTAGNNNSGDNLQNQNQNSTLSNDIGPVKQVQPGAGTTLPQLNNGVKNLDLLGKFNDLSAIRGMAGGLIAGLALGALGVAIPTLLAGLLALLLAKLVALLKRGVSFIKKLASKAKDKVKNGGKKIAEKTKEGAKKVAKKTKSGAKTGASKVKTGANKIATKTKSAANSTAELFKKARK